jgi:hypothetical protein
VKYPEDPGWVPSSDTSLGAARSMRDASKVMKTLAMAHVRQAGSQGITCDELEVITGWRHQSASTRLRELVLDGQIIDSGRRRPTRSNRAANVYVVKRRRRMVRVPTK